MTKSQKSDGKEPPLQTSETTFSNPSDEGDAVKTSTVILPDDGNSFGFAGTDGHWKIESTDTDERFVIAHYPIAPRTLVAPSHCHHNEDEYSYVLDGTLGALVDEEAVTAEAGTWVIKPRGQWHTLWNASDTPCYVIEIVSPAGFEGYFREVAASEGDMERLAQINEQYGIEMDFESVPALCERFGLTFSEP